MTFKQDNNWRKVRFCIEQTLIVSFSGLSAAQPLDRRVFNEYYYICIIHKTDLQKVCYLKHVRLSNHFVLIFLLLDDVALGHPDVVVVDSELMLSTRKKVGHIATSRTVPFSSDYPPSFCTCCPKIFPPGAVHHVQKELLRLGSTLVHVQALFYISLPQICSWLGTIQSCSLTELSRIQDGAFGISSCPPH